MTSAEIVYVVDDDESVRRALSRLLRSAGLNVETFPSAQAFLGRELPDRTACLVLDVRLPGLSGLDLQAYLEVRHPELAERTCFVSGLVGTPREAELLARVPRHRLVGKPFTPEELLAAIAALAPSSS